MWRAEYSFYPSALLIIRGCLVVSVPCLLEVASPPGNSIVLLRDISSCVGSEIWRGMTVTHSEPEWCFVHELLCKSQFAHKKTHHALA